MLFSLSMSESSRDLAVKLGTFRVCVGLDGFKIHQDFEAVGAPTLYSNYRNSTKKLDAQLEHYFHVCSGLQFSKSPVRRT